eukprot:gene72-12892_t
MSNFGCTSLGHSEPVLAGTAPSQEYIFHEFPVDSYLDAFNKYLLGENSQIATTLEVDGTTHVLRASLGDMIREILGRPPRKFELDAWFTYLDYERSPLLSQDEYIGQVEMLVMFSASPAAPKEYTSHTKLHTDWVKHARHGYEVQSTLRGPMTTSHDIGWHTAKPGPKTKSFATNHTDVTLREGNTARSYYGHFIVDK